MGSRVIQATLPMCTVNGLGLYSTPIYVNITTLHAWCSEWSVHFLLLLAFTYGRVGRPLSTGKAGDDATPHQPVIAVTRELHTAPNIWNT